MVEINASFSEEQIAKILRLLGSNDNIEELMIRDIDEIQIAQTLGLVLRNNTNLKCIEFKECRMSPFKYLVDTLSTNKTILSLIRDSGDLHDNLDIYLKDLESLAEILNKPDSAIQSLMFSVTLTNEEDITSLIERIARVCLSDNSLRCLNLSSNNIGIKGIKYISESLSKNTTLRTLYLAGNADQNLDEMFSIGNNGAYYLARH